VNYGPDKKRQYFIKTIKFDSTINKGFYNKIGENMKKYVQNYSQIKNEVHELGYVGFNSIQYFITQIKCHDGTV